MSDYYLAVCDSCRVAVPMEVSERDAWGAKHSHDSDEGEEL